MIKSVNLFFMGKGGVGKSTSSALYSVYLAEKGYKVLMVSLDPAHNQSDIFKKSFSDKPTKVTNAFSVIEVDQEKWIKLYLKEIQLQINRTYTYLTAFNLEGYFKVIKHSPGLEEYALILAFNHIQNNFTDYDYLIFDMAPTALSLKFFNLLAPLVFVLSVIFGIAAPIFFRSLFAHKISNEKSTTESKLIKFEQSLIRIALVTPYLGLIAYFLEFQKFYFSATFIMALYSVYYFYPSQKRIAFEKRIFRVK